MKYHEHHPWQAPALAAGAAVWALAWLVLLLLDGQLDLANLALLPVLAAAVAALWWPAGLSVAACAATVLAFNWTFVPPRGSLSVDLHQHALLLLTLLAVSWIVTLLVARQRRLAASERQHAQRAQQLQTLATTLRESEDPRDGAPALQAALLTCLQGDPAPAARLKTTTSHAAGAFEVALLLLQDALPARDDPAAVYRLGATTADQTAGLWLCLRQQRAMGPGTGWHDDERAWYLPVRGRGTCWGAAVLPLPGADAGSGAAAGLRRQHAQALCDQMGLALQRTAAVQAATAAREDARSQRMHNTLLAAIAHDHRTPLATILGAASALHDQMDRLPQAQQRQLAARIVDETRQLQRVTDNTLQLARLDAPGLVLRLDWESVEEMVGSVLHRMRGRHPQHRIKARLEANLPLLRCDAVLLVQLLDNLLDNALKHGGDPALVEVLARRVAGEWPGAPAPGGESCPGAGNLWLLLAVRDRGPGVPPAWRDRVFGAFQRGEPSGAAPLNAARAGVGVGLALCRSIVRAHGGTLILRPRSRGGSSFECRLQLLASPLPPPPPPLHPAWPVASYPDLHAAVEAEPAPAHHSGPTSAGGNSR